MGSECEVVKEQLNQYRLGKLSEAEKAEVESHLLVCPECIFLLTLVPSLNQD
ncbi:MAG TPA: zf-HC2 domain-containing protein [bacterium]|nr:zf-HC2 domain-containing protein [bacterium]